MTEKKLFLDGLLMEMRYISFISYCWSDFYVTKFTHWCQNSPFCKLRNRILNKLKTSQLFFNPLTHFSLSDYLFLDQWQSCISLKGPLATWSCSGTTNQTLTWWENVYIWDIYKQFDFIQTRKPIFNVYVT